MAGKIIADTIETGAGADISTSYVVNGSAKAWVNFNARGTLAVQDSLNYTSVTDNGQGDYTGAYSSAFNNDDYTTLSSLMTEHNSSRGCFFLAIAIESDNSLTLYTTTQVRMYSNYGASASSNGGEYDPTPCHINHMGDLA